MPVTTTTFNKFESGNAFLLLRDGVSRLLLRDVASKFLLGHALASVTGHDAFTTATWTTIEVA